MTANDVFKQAMGLLNYTNSYGEVDSRQHAELFRRALAVVNQIYTDLHVIETGQAPTPLTHMSGQLALSHLTLSGVMPYGVAMLLAQSENDGDGQSLFASLYNQKRSLVPRPPERRADVIPGGWA